MRVIVLGAGVIGVTTAYYLAKSGHDVVVVDRQSDVAMETSFANAGEVSPGYASPWAAPGLPKKVLTWLLMEHAPLIWRPQFDACLFKWLAAFARNCTAERYALNKGRMVRLAEYSRDQLVALRSMTAIAYDHRSLGTLQVFRTQKQVDDAALDTKILKSHGVAFEILDTKGCVTIEPGLAYARDRIVGGLRLPGDETGDCYMFTNAVARLAQSLGVTFNRETTVRGLIRGHDQITSVQTNKGALSGDAFVVALGSFSSAMLRSIGLPLPVYPVKGYSITLPTLSDERAPQSTLLDETYKIAITRLGDRIRVGGMAEIAGFNLDLVERRRRTLHFTLNSLFPGAGDVGRATFWAGLRPMTPDGTPIVGRCTISNLYLNTGHGTLGWTMACGSGRIIADIVSGTSPDIETADLSISRYAP